MSRAWHVSALLAVVGVLAISAAPALARPVAGDGVAASTTPLRAAVADSVACEVLRGVRLCTHGDDAHLHGTHAAGGQSGSSTTSSTRIGCYGDGRSGSRVQAVYARPISSADAYSSMLPSFRGWAGAVEKDIDDSAHQTKGARHVRFATVPSGSSCVLSVLRVALPDNAFSSFSATISALQERGLDAANVKYLVWADAAGYCGIGTTYQDDRATQDNLNNGGSPSYARVDRKCWGKAETHELVHMLGGVQAGAPHATAGHHCRDGADVMCYDDGTAGSRQTSVCAAAHARLLDCRHDDYFSTSPPAGSWLAGHWNVAHSAFLARDWTEPAARPAPSAAPSSAPSSRPSPSASPSTSPSPRPSPSASSPVPTVLPVPLPVPLPVLSPLRLPTPPVPVALVPVRRW